VRLPDPWLRDGPHGGLGGSGLGNDGLGREPAWLEDWGPIARSLAERLACDAAMYRIILDPTSGLPLDLGRTYRLTPPWMRKALCARDRGCRWPGCKTEASWCDAHHCRYWKAHEGPTCITNLILLCRYHHVLVHEGKWQLGFDPTTGEVTITRPDGRPYELPPSTPWTRACTRANDPWPDG
jgi:hypothetical protein